MMLSGYFKTAFRSLWKNRGYSFLNLAGLAIGIASAALIFLWVEDELTYNSYFTNSENLYKVKDHQTYDGTTFTFDATPGPMAAGIQAEIPGIRHAARCTWDTKKLFSLHEKTLFQQGNYVDPAFLAMFRVEFVQGNAATAFNQLYSLVITEKMAQAFFGRIDVVGQTLKVDNAQEYLITGVIKDLPKNVSFNFDWLAPFQIFENENGWLESWGNNGVLTYVETIPTANIAAMNKQLYSYIQTKFEEANAKMELYPMARWRLYDSWENGKEVAGTIKFVKLFTLIAWIVLIIACINFMNLATARSEQRAREVGVRKVMGAPKAKLIIQFIVESLFMALVSTLLALLLVYLFLPGFNTLVSKELTLDLFAPLHISSLLGIVLVCGLLAGSYPAFYLSAFNPVYVLKGIKIKNQGSAGFIRKGLVVLQFTISVVLIISTIIIYQQLHHVKSRDLGYKKEGLLYINLNGKVRDHFAAIKNDMIQSGVVANAALSRSMVLQLGSNTGDFSWQGRDPRKSVLVTLESTSPEYIATMGMKLLSGRDFSPDTKADSGNVIVNEALARLVSKDGNAVGKLLYYGDGNYTIVGVVNDFVYNNMYSSSAPAVFFSELPGTNFLTVRLKPGVAMSTALPVLEGIMKKNNPGYPAEFKFVDQAFEKYFKTETLVGKLAAIFALLAIVISCLGLFGLAAYTAERRTKEMGIRKILGASAARLAGLLSRDFLKLVGLSCLISFPMAWWMMYNWIQNFEYRIEMSWWVYAGAAALAIFIALLTVSFQAVKAAVTNPVKNLRSE